MVEFFKVNEDIDTVTYRYTPCTRIDGEYPDDGIIRLDKKTGDCTIEKLSSIDNPIRMFVNKVLPRLVSFWKKNDYQDQGVVYWC